MDNIFLEYTSARGKKVIFDDWTESQDIDDNDVVWVEMCKSCHRKHRHILKGRFDNNPGVGTCSVKGCENEADYYVDFKPEDVREVRIAPTLDDEVWVNCDGKEDKWRRADAINFFTECLLAVFPNEGTERYANVLRNLKAGRMYCTETY